MAWSTREVAELAGTTLRTVRHYHEVGALDPPERGENGYKLYGVADLGRLLQIRRLVGLGFSLPQIVSMRDGAQGTTEALRGLDAELADEQERLRLARADIAALLDPAGSGTLPIELLAQFDPRFTEHDRTFLAVAAAVIDPAHSQDFAELIRRCADEPVFAEFDALAPEADADVRAALARRMALPARAVRAGSPSPDDMLAAGGVSSGSDTSDVARAVSRFYGLYNGAQMSVLIELRKLIDGPDEAR